MVDVRGGLRFAFSVVFAPHEKFESKDLKLDTRMFPGTQQVQQVSVKDLDDQKKRPILKAVKKLKEKLSQNQLNKIKEKGVMNVYLVQKGLTEDKIKILEKQIELNNLGAFLDKIEKEPEAISKLLQLKSKDKLEFILKLGKQSFGTLQETIKNPQSVVETAIFQCFELFQISKENVNLYTSDDGESMYIDDSREFSISFKHDNDIEEMDSLKDISNDKKHGFEVNWVIFNINNEKWAERLQNIAAIATATLLKRIIPGISSTVGSMIKKVIKSKSEELFNIKCNQDFRLIFYVLLRANLAIESIKFQKFEANLFDEKEKKEILKQFGANLFQSTNIVARIKDHI